VNILKVFTSMALRMASNFYLYNSTTLVYIIHDILKIIVKKKLKNYIKLRYKLQVGNLQLLIY